MQPFETPQPPRAPRRDGWTPARRERFLEHLAAGLDVKRACTLVGMSRQKAYTLRGRDAAFANAWDEARCAARAGADEAFLALLPERLLGNMSELSAARELRARQTPSRTVSEVSGSSHLRPAQAAAGVSAEREDGVLPLDPVPSVPLVSPSPRVGTPAWARAMLVTLNSVQGPSLRRHPRSRRRDGC